MKVLLVDDDAAVRKMLRRILDRRTSLEVVGEASSGVEGLELVIRLQPDLVVMDVEMPGMDGVAATNEIKRTCPETQVVAFTSAEDESTRAAMLKAGAAAFLVKDQPLEEIIAAFHEAQHSFDEARGRGHNSDS